MRLVCPKCSAQYEVAENAIPEEGRDVQCANCGNTWFQGRDGVAAAPGVSEPAKTQDAQSQRTATPQADQKVLDILRREAALNAATDKDEAEKPEPAEEIAVEAEVETEVDPEPEEDLEADEETEAEIVSEVEIEVEAEAEPVIEEEKLSLRERAARNRLSAKRERSPRPDATVNVATEDEHINQPGMIEDHYDAAPAPQREIENPDLPDIDALNSTLRAANDGSRSKEAKKKRRGREKEKPALNRYGFYLAVLIFLVLLAAYSLKPQITAAVPGLEPYLDRYGNIVDIARHGLASGVDALIEAAKNLIGTYL